MLENAGGHGGSEGGGALGAGDGRDARGTYGGGALGIDKATNTRTRALRGAQKQPIKKRHDSTGFGHDTAHGSLSRYLTYTDDE